MNLFQIYMLFFGFTTLIGVPLLSSFQITQIKGSSWADWLSSLGTSLGPAAGIFVVITIVVYFIMKPALKILKKAETETISDDELKSVEKTLSKIRIITTASLLGGYPLGNGTTIIIKTITTKVNYSFVDLSIIMILILCYGFLAVQYSTNGFETAARKQLLKLKITKSDIFKKNPITLTFGRAIMISILTVSWHAFCSGYSAVRNGWSTSYFIGKAFFGLIQSLIICLPLVIVMLIQLKIRFNMSINQIINLRRRP